MLYLGSGGLEQNRRQAVEWLRKAAEGNFPDAYLTLSHAYATASGVDAADVRRAYCFLVLLERMSSVREYRMLAQQQRAAMLIGAAERKSIEESAKRGSDCL